MTIRRVLDQLRIEDGRDQKKDISDALTSVARPEGVYRYRGQPGSNGTSGGEKGLCAARDWIRKVMNF